MKISRQAQREAKQLFQACHEEDNLSESKARETVKLLLEKKPRDFVAILSHLHRLIKLDVQRRTAVVQSAIALNENQQTQVKEIFQKSTVITLTILSLKTPN